MALLTAEELPGKLCCVEHVRSPRRNDGSTAGRVRGSSAMRHLLQVFDEALCGADLEGIVFSRVSPATSRDLTKGLGHHFRWLFCRTNKEQRRLWHSNECWICVPDPEEEEPNGDEHVIGRERLRTEMTRCT
jgi:hypothetical protein